MENLEVENRTHEHEAIESLFSLHGTDTTHNIKETLFRASIAPEATDQDKTNIMLLWDFMSKFE